MSPDDELLADFVRARYQKRIVDDHISDVLRAFGGVYIMGPKWCGKSWTGMYHSNSYFLVDEEDNADYADRHPKEALKGDFPRLIDEWQIVPKLWDVARREVDFSDGPGMFIFTGSASPPKEERQHSGVGRFARVMMRPMSLFESGRSSGAVSIAKMFDGTERYEGRSTINASEAVRLICRGGWPAGLKLDEDIAAMVPASYASMISSADLSRIYGDSWKPSIMGRVIRSLARNNATEATLSTLISDVANEEERMSEPTARKYLGILKDLYLIVEQEAWDPSPRSRTFLRTSPKRHFVDPSLAVASLGVSPEKLMANPRFVGFLFESLCYRDLCVYVENSYGKVYHYRDKYNLEVDCIVESKDGKWGAIEVKLSSSDFEIAAANLLALKKRMASDAPAPAFLAILSASGGGAYLRDDGIAVIPLDCMGP